ncbi:MAG: ABC transporter ATP-binding protein [Nannocystaceae bacterium]
MMLDEHTNEDSIVVSNLSHSFGTTASTRVEVLHGIDVAVPRGSLCVLMGASGSGKTTLLTLIGCLRDVQRGSVRVMGAELAGATKDVQLATRRRLGFIFQAHNLHGSLSATQNVLMGLQVSGRRDASRELHAAHHVLDLVGLADRRDYMPAQLSGGQKQRVAVARALVGNPDVILADEPTAALDKDSTKEVVTLLRRLAQERGTTSIVVTHDSRVLDYADRVIHLRDGRIFDEN